MHVKYLTPDEQLLVDPTGKGRAAIESMKAGRPTPVPSIFSDYNREEAFTQWNALAHRIVGHNSKHQWLLEVDDSYMKKCGAQGARCDLSVIQEHYLHSYSNAKYRPRYNLVRIGRSYLLRLVKDLIARYGVPSPNPAYRGTVGTSGALPTMQSKGSFLAETVNMTPWRHVFPNLPGQRAQRNAFRCINQDACSNVRYVEELFARVRDWFKKYLPSLTAAWINPELELGPRLYSHILRRHETVEGDFSACDEHTSLEEAQFILPIFELLLDPMEYAKLAAYVEEAFYQPIYFGAYMWVGKHNALSGQVLVSDLETYYDMCLQIGAILSVCPGRLADFDIFQLGDDMLIIGSMSASLQLELRDALVEEATLNGHVMHPAKCRLGKDGTVAFLKRHYTCHLRPAVNCRGEFFMHGHYPLTLALNSCRNPERYEPDPVKQWGELLQRLDNTYGSPLFLPFVQFVGSSTKKDLRPTYDQLCDVQIEDWWSRLYGISWKPDASPAFHALVRSKIL